MRQNVIKKVMINAVSAWDTDVTGRSFILFSINHRTHRISFEYEGCDIYRGQLWELCLSDPDIREEILWGLVNQHDRKNYAQVECNHGMSGCCDWSIRVYKGGEETAQYFKGWAPFKIHESCFGKVVPRFEVHALDLAPMVAAWGPFSIGYDGYTIIDDKTQHPVKRPGKYIKPIINKGTVQPVINCIDDNVTGTSAIKLRTTPEARRRLYPVHYLINE